MGSQSQGNDFPIGNWQGIKQRVILLAMLVMLALALVMLALVLLGISLVVFYSVIQSQLNTFKNLISNLILFSVVILDLLVCVCVW